MKRVTLRSICREFALHPHAFRPLQPSSCLHLSMPNFHLRFFNRAWEVSKTLIVSMSFRMSDEITTESLEASDAQRKGMGLTSPSSIYLWIYTRRQLFQGETIPSYHADHGLGLLISDAEREGGERDKVEDGIMRRIECYQCTCLTARSRWRSSTAGAGGQEV